ncbi:MAG: ATP-binding cassette domain-containing protein, partial [Patescibacteria group bacterium]
LRAEEFLRILGRGLGAKASDTGRLLGLVGLSEHSRKFLKAYSRGMIQRLGLAIALLKQPRILILDEPALGLDPIGQHQLLSLLLELNKQGRTIFFSSHILSQIEKVAHRIGILHQGSLRFAGAINELLAKHGSLSLEESFLKEVTEKHDA